MNQHQINEAWGKWKRDDPKAYDKFQHWTKYHLKKMCELNELEAFRFDEEEPIFLDEVHGNEETLGYGGAGEEWTGLPGGNRMKKSILGAGSNEE